MDKRHGDSYYTTAKSESADEGWIGVDLYRTRAGEKARVARVVFWDASGEFAIETLGEDVPLAIAEELIAEAKATISID